MPSLITLSFYDLALASLPALMVLWICYRWSVDTRHASYALLRMLTQLLLVGYALNYIFASQSSLVILLILAIMCLASCWIALGSVAEHRQALFGYALVAMLCGGGLTLVFITQGTLHISPWYAPHYMIPIAGMIFANAMNSVSLGAERLQTELTHQPSYQAARNKAFHAAMIPVTNSLLAVGLVSLPGMMTGQILSGVSPFIAARYQIMVMIMVFAASGLATALYLLLAKHFYQHS